VKDPGTAGAAPTKGADVTLPNGSVTVNVNVPGTAKAAGIGALQTDPVPLAVTVATSVTGAPETAEFASVKVKAEATAGGSASFQWAIADMGISLMIRG
jgi:hypothetical protein